MPSAAPTPSVASGNVPEGSLIVKEETTAPATKATAPKAQDDPARAKGPLAGAGRQTQKEEAGKSDDEGGEEGLEISSEEEDDDAVLPEAQHSEPRNEVDAKTAKFRPNAVHVYGLDFLKTGHMDEIFSQFSHKYVEWINDSSANIVFADAPSAKQALEALSFPKVGDEPWRRTPDILVSEDVPAIFLQMRFAAPTDVKKAKKSIPKAVPVVYTRASRRGQGNSTPGVRRVLYADGDREATAEARPAKKRPKVVNEEELQKRRKRALRFGESQAADAAATAEAAPAATVAAPAEAPAEKAAPGKSQAMPAPELTEEELAKRRKRAERFASEAAAAAVQAPAEAAAEAAPAP